MTNQLFTPLQAEQEHCLHNSVVNIRGWCCAHHKCQEKNEHPRVQIKEKSVTIFYRDKKGSHIDLREEQ